MTDEQRQRVLAGGQLIPDDVRDAAYQCLCGRSLPVANMPHQCPHDGEEQQPARK